MNKARYFTFLLEKADAMYNPKRVKYQLLLKTLFDIPFEWYLPMDKNRADDGLSLRVLYFNETGNRFDQFTPCTVLEMMLALSFRMETDIMGEPGNNHPERWFWDMLMNLGLLTESNDRFNDAEVRSTIKKWLSRSYDKFDGYGGIFPLKTDRPDQRKLPIWEQMAEYLNERC